MDEYGPSTYGDRIADVYDTLYGDVPFSGDPSRTAAFLHDLAGSRPALELGIGTGRAALPLALTRTEVHGIDASEAMVSRLREAWRTGSARYIGDFSDFSLPARFGVVYVVFNTFFGLRGTGRLLPRGGPTPAARRRVRHGGVRARPGPLRPRAARLAIAVSRTRRRSR